MGRGVHRIETVVCLLKEDERARSYPVRPEKRCCIVLPIVEETHKRLRGDYTTKKSARTEMGTVCVSPCWLETDAWPFSLGLKGWSRGGETHGGRTKPDSVSKREGEIVFLMGRVSTPGLW